MFCLNIELKLALTTKNVSIVARKQKKTRNLQKLNIEYLFISVFICVQFGSSNPILI